MKKLLSVFLATMIFVLFLSSMAAAAIETRNYGWNLGKYDTMKKIFTPSDTTSINWNGMTVRTIGPWNVNQNTSTNRVGSIISFVDKNKPADNGYPMIGEPQWDQWITQFKGNSSYVKSALNTWNIDTNSGRFKFANFSQLVELCGGKGQTYNISNASSVYLSSEPPYATLLANRTAVKAGESVIFNIRGQSNTFYSQFIDVSFAGAGNTFWTDKRFGGPRVDTTYTHTFNTPGTYTFSIIVKDSVWRTATSKVTVAVGPKDAPLPPGPEQPEPEEPDEPDEPTQANQAPTARFGWPTECWEGDTVDVIENSYDRDGEIVDWRWRFTNALGITHNLKQGGGQVGFQNSGTYELRLTVEDDEGATDSVTKTLLVKPPIPLAKIDYSGSLKENRKITLDASNSSSPLKFPIDFTKNEWTIMAISGGTASDIKMGSRGERSLDILFKKAGTYRVGLRVYNARYASEWVYTDLVIGPDLPPVANFLTSSIVLRNPADQNNAAIKLYDTSYSADYDPLTQRIWKYKFDSNNNGIFTDEPWIAIDSGNSLQTQVKTSKVGKYLFELEIKEGFAQDTIPAFVNDSDYLRDNTDDKPVAQKMVEVQNVAPTTSFTSSIQSKIDIVFSQGFLTEFNSRFPNMVSNLESIVGAKLTSKGIDYAFYNTEADSGGPERITRESHGPWGPDQINSDGLGYYTKTRVLDLGRSINTSDIINGWFTFDGYCPSGDTTNWSVAVSNDHISWSRIYNWISPSQSTAWRPYQAVSLTPGNIPISSFRYVKAYINPSDYALDSFTVDILLNSANSSLNQSNGTQQHATIIDLGKNIDTSALAEYRLQFQGSAADTYTLSVSPDNITWTTVGTWSCSLGTNLSYVWQWKYISKNSIPIPGFRYCKLSAATASIDLMQQNITYTSAARAKLSDIQEKANAAYREGGIKYIISLAEEPYIDANSATVNAAANSLNQNKAYLVAFTNSAGLSSVQQLADKVEKQKIITTSTDLSPALNQLADYIISQKTAGSEMTGFIPVLQDEVLTYNPIYNDYENDPKYAENWYIVHAPDFVDNPTGLSAYNNKTYAAPPGIFDKVGKYDIQYKARDNPANGDMRFSDYFLWSSPAPTSVVVHRKPIARFAVQPGTLYITDQSYDPDFQYKRPDKGVTEWFWQWKKTTDTSWSAGKPTAAVTQPGNYYFYLKVKDVYGVWSDPYQMAITVTDPNRPPVVDFNWTPVLVYEGDQVTLNNLTYDPDDDPLTYQWTVYNPLGVTNTYAAKNITLNKVLQGTYWITLRAWDNKNATDVATKSFFVNTLGINGQVRHTDQWNQKRIAYNLAASGSENIPRGYNVYWAGERFILKADTTDTGISATKAQSVTVHFPYGGDVLLTPNQNKTTWAGEMWQKAFENIPDGSYVFTFTAAYTNGTVKTQDVPVVISQTIYSVYQFHRTQ